MIKHTGKLISSILLPIKLTNGNGGRGTAFWKSAKLRKDYEALLRRLGHVYEPFLYRVEIRVTRLLGPRERLWDFSSGLRGSWKELEDSIVACGWLTDDGPQYVGGITFWQEKSASGKSETLIEFYES